jgi:hypothetical protein
MKMKLFILGIFFGIIIGLIFGAVYTNNVWKNRVADHVLPFDHDTWSEFMRPVDNALERQDITLDQFNWIGLHVDSIISQPAWGSDLEYETLEDQIKEEITRCLYVDDYIPFGHNPEIIEE